MKNLLIFGSGDHAKVIISEVLKLKKAYNPMGFCCEKKKIGKVIFKAKNKKYSIICNFKDINKKIKKKKFYGIIGVADNFVRKKIYNELKKNRNIIWESIISIDAKRNANVKIGKGSFIASNNFINTGTIIEDHCLINTSTSLDHDNLFKNFSSTAPGVITGGNVIVGESSHIGVGAKIQNNIKIEKNTIIGSGSIVIKNCKKDSVYFGSPAKFIRKKKLNERFLSKK